MTARTTCACGKMDVVKNVFRTKPHLEAASLMHERLRSNKSRRRHRLLVMTHIDGKRKLVSLQTAHKHHPNLRPILPSVKLMSCHPRHREAKKRRKVRTIFDRLTVHQHSTRALPFGRQIQCHFVSCEHDSIVWQECNLEFPSMV
jgi:hypothetical protein